MCEIFQAKDGYDCHMKLEILGIFCVRKFFFPDASHAQMGKISRKIIESHA